MKNWKVKLLCQEKNIEALIKAKTYADAYVRAGTEYPDCVIKGVTEVRKK